MRKWIELQAKKRMRAIAVLFFLFAAALLGKLFHVQIMQHEFLTSRAEENWDIEIPFGDLRGHILDRNEALIVGNELAPTLYFMPAQNDQVKAVSEALAKILKEDATVIEEKLSKKAYMIKLAPEGKNMTPAQAEEIAKLQIPGLYTGVDFVRYYPHRDMLARLLGFTGYDQQGLAGLEFAYDDVLQGKGDKIRLFTDAKGIPLPHVDDGFSSGAKGHSIQLTIDLHIQQIVERELQQAMEKYEASQALAIAMNPKTGEILALASMPTFHPNNYQEVDQSIYNRNLPVWMTFEPGSTFKIITLAAGLEESLIDLHEDHFYDPGYVRVANARLRCWKREGHGSQSYLEVVENSCNPGFVSIGQKLGADKLDGYIRKFGFGSSTESGITGEAKGILFSEQNFGPVEQATTAFGQGISVTPIQQVQAVAATINGGNLYQPYLIRKIIDDKGKTVQTFEPNLKEQVISEATSTQVRAALESVVANGSGRNAFVDGLRVAGKTGTAQKAVDGVYKEGEYIVSFIGFAPADDPEILVYVAVDSPRNSVQFGGVIAAPMVGRIIEEAAPLLGIERREDQLEKDYRWGDELTHRAPNLVGLTKEKVRSQLYTYRIEWHGEGDRVDVQLPAPDTLIQIDDIIHVYSK